MKFKLPKLHKQRLQAATRRMPQRTMDDIDDAEPNMKLSSAFIVVLVLHVVAVAGIYAFNSIKAHKTAAAENREATLKATSEPAAPPPVAKTAMRTVTDTPVAKTAAAPPRPAGDAKASTKTTEVAKKSAPAPTAKKTAPAAAKRATTYTVVKGDKALFIAKKFGVDYNELVKLNRIDDPAKLQIGQKLTLPPRSKAD